MNAMILALVVMSAGCSGYTSHTLREGDAHFSFEYYDSYEKKASSLYSGHTMVYFNRSLMEEGLLDSSFYVLVYEAGWLGNPDAEAALEDRIASYATDEYHRDFEILDRSSVTIAGVEGEQVTFCYYAERKLVGDSEGPFFKLPATLIARCVYFDHNGFIWEIFMKSIEEVAEEDKVHFEHIIETFTILD